MEEVICHDPGDGAYNLFVIDNITEKILIANYFDDSVHSVLEDLFSNNVYPIVYACLK